MAFSLRDQPYITRGWVRALVFFIAYVGIYFMVGAGAGFLWVMKIGPENAQELVKNPYPLTMTIQMISCLAVIGMALVFRRGVDRASIASMGFTWKGHEREAVAGFLLGIVLLGGGSLLLYATGNIDWVDTQFAAGPMAIAFLLFLLTAFSEEIAFRGYILNNLLSSFNKWIALGAAAVLFMLMHLGNANLTPVAFINLLAGGVLLGMNYVFVRNLWFSICFHFSWNFFQGSILGYEVSGLGLQSLFQMDRKDNLLLTGGAFGFEGSIVATGLLVLAILFVAYRRWWKW
ncbi:CPBP family intramembrane glutamic endopeptidase [Paraflavitalea sp. CAU 1676]|uniref:CPBP family intramembrane glutamic endopeptidase n=1 Tax=Paraflavitalea sp. CAU 1676 TaxID=3032598 RepID=UPI0023DA9BB0|nr:CPBP family intramembrane glutamic endopeptidase [Paraflavitalea sp. CAU 1676]MDF2192492.1 CPBP family glutamic-type intramembrane protease [Paraflavitalea sp. CAU 1676]